ncbi:hypothetical protein CJ030_MR7G001384 [Morella rubra]|uniref:Heavy metal-associated isoprenylated plant protein 47 n=1 Tax=Morella rubra TaxID=262757 RepID=A0A6A1V7M3_9ROSI|nr:hypothetical protein CJ030_MR7G001384 [Morella rubra]
MTKDKFRNQAMKSAVSKYGVISVAIEGPDNDQLVVIGEGVDAVNLTRSLQKKLRCATLLRVEELEEPVEPAVEPATVEPAVPSVEQSNNPVGTFSPPPAAVYYYQVVCDPDPYYPCSIM